MSAPAALVARSLPLEADAAATTWHIITGEYPPQPGGVSDYTEAVAHGLADAGDLVVVWAPHHPDRRGHPRVEVRNLPGRFGPRALWRMSLALAAQRGPHRVLVQYVPHAFGWKAANLLFCTWLRLRRRDHIWVMFHEVSYPFDRDDTLRRNALAAVNRVMARLVGGAASRAFVSIPAWRPAVEAMTDRAVTVRWLPVPSAIPVVDDRSGCETMRRRFAGDRTLVGHFGTYSLRICAALEDAVLEMLSRVDCAVLLLGRGSDRVAHDLGSRHPELAGRIHGAGVLSPDDVSRAIGACDLMLQPYPDGISTRRTSAMAALAHGRPLVTTVGPLSEPFWADAGAAVLVEVDDRAGLGAAAADVLASAPRRLELSTRAAALYHDRFALAHTIDVLRHSR